MSFGLFKPSLSIPRILPRQFTYSRAFSNTIRMAGDKTTKFNHLPLATNKPMECALTVNISQTAM